jgi:pimeloyl-ACP methyl ester carboxylesterase
VSGVEPIQVQFFDLRPRRHAAQRRMWKLLAAWHTIPSTYVIGEQDAAIPYAMRERFAARAGSVARMDTSHSPFLSRPGETAALLRDQLALARRD